MDAPFDMHLSAQEARTLLWAIEQLCQQLVNESLKALDAQTAGGGLSADQALAFCHEIAAYRRIVGRLRRKVKNAEGQLAAAATEASHAG